MLEANILQLETGGVTILGSAFDSSAWLQCYLAERPRMSYIEPSRVTKLEDTDAGVFSPRHLPLEGLLENNS